MGSWGVVGLACWFCVYTCFLAVGMVFFSHQKEADFGLYTEEIGSKQLGHLKSKSEMV